MTNCSLFQVCKTSSAFKNQCDVIHHMNRVKKKNDKSTPIDAEKAFKKIQHSFHDKTLSKLGILFLNMINLQRPTANIKHNSEKIDAFPLRSVTRPGCHLSLLLFNTVLEILANAVR